MTTRLAGQIRRWLGKSEKEVEAEAVALPCSFQVRCCHGFGAVPKGLRDPRRYDQDRPRPYSSFSSTDRAKW